MIRTNIRIGKYSNIFEYPNIRHTMIHNGLCYPTIKSDSILNFRNVLIFSAEDLHNLARSVVSVEHSGQPFGYLFFNLA